MTLPETKMGAVHKHQIIEKAITDLIEKNILKEGDAVPSIRKMSMLYNMSPTPVIEAYKNLEAKGVIESHPKSRFTVAVSNQDPEAEEQTSSDPFPVVFTSRRKELPNPYAKTKSTIELDLSRPDMERGIVPADRCLKYIIRTLKNDPGVLNIDSRGYDDEKLVRIITRQMLQSMCAIKKEEICITGKGIEETIRLALKACTKSNDTVILTSPCSPAHVYACRALGLRHTFVHHSAGGHSVDIDAFEHMIRKDRNIKCLLISGGLINPDGYYPDNECKERLANICRQYDIAVIEDDSDRALFFGDRYPKLFKELIPEQTIYVSSFTTSILNELNIHWACPGKYTRVYRMMRDNESLSAYAFLQKALAEFAETSQYRSCLEATRALLKKTISQVRKAVFENFPGGILVSDPDGGFNLHIILPETIRNVRLKGLAYNNGIGISCDNEFFLEENGIVVNCSVIAADMNKIKSIETLGTLANSAISLKQ